MISVKKLMLISSLLVLDKMGLEIMFVDHPIRKQAFLDKKISILHRGHTGIVSNWLTHDLFKNWKKFHLSGILDK